LLFVAVVLKVFSFDDIRARERGEGFPRLLFDLVNKLDRIYHLNGHFARIFFQLQGLWLNLAMLTLVKIVSEHGTRVADII